MLDELVAHDRYLFAFEVPHLRQSLHEFEHSVSVVVIALQAILHLGSQLVGLLARLAVLRARNISGPFHPAPER